MGLNQFVEPRVLLRMLGRVPKELYPSSEFLVPLNFLLVYLRVVCNGDEERKHWPVWAPSISLQTPLTPTRPTVTHFNSL